MRKKISYLLGILSLIFCFFLSGCFVKKGDYKICYDANEGIFSNGKSLITQYVKKGELLDFSLIPTREDYDFYYWSTTFDEVGKIDLETYYVSSDITLHAIWKQSSFEILQYSSKFHYSTNNESSIQTMFITIGEEETSLDLKNELYCKEDSTWKIKNLEGTVVSNLKPGDNPVTICVSSKYGTRIKEYLINIHRRYRIDISYKVDNQIVFIDSILSGDIYQVKTDIDISIEGYKVKSWSKEGHTVESYFAFKNATLVANLTPNLYKITFDSSKGYLSSSQTKEIYYKDIVKLPNVYRQGYTFKGWYLNEELLGEVDSEVTWELASDATLVAHWEPINYSLELKCVPQEAGTVSGGCIADFDSKVTIQATINSGYSFLGWYDNLDNFLSNDLVYEATIKGYNLVAKYQKCNLIAKANYGDVVIPETSIIGKPIRIKPALNSLRGFVFDGWYQFTTKVSSELEYEFILSDKSQTYEARWKNPDLEIFKLDVTETECKVLGLLDFVHPKILYIPEAVTEIKERAFEGNTTIYQVIIADGPLKIESYAFSRCYSLVKLEIGNTLKEISSTAFLNCRKLIEVKNTSDCAVDVPSVLHQYSEGESYIQEDGEYVYYITSDVRYLLGYIGNAKDIILPETVLDQEYQIYNHAFHGIDFLEKITISRKVSAIGENAFRGCKNLIEIQYNAESIDAVEKDTFAAEDSSNPSKNISIHIGENVKSIPDNFLYASAPLNVVSVDFTEDSQCKSIGKFAFHSLKNLKKIIIPSAVEWIGQYAYSGCSNVIEIQYFAKTCIIEDSLFSYVGVNSEGVSLIIEPSVTMIPKKFMSPLYGRGYPKITSYIIEGDNLCEIGREAFQGLSLLKKITIPSSVTQIGQNAFADCTGVEEVEYNAILLNQSISSLEPIFKNLGSDSGFILKIGDQVSKIPSNLFSALTTLNSIVFSKNSQCVEIESYAFTATKIKELELPNSIKKIGDYAFENCSLLKELTIGEGVETLSYISFYKCSSVETIFWNAIHASFTSYGLGYSLIGTSSSKGITVTFGNSVKRIPNQFFSESTALKSIIFDENSGLTEIGEFAFYNSSLQIAHIPSKVSKIGNHAFSNCKNLNELHFDTEQTLEFIGNTAFENCGTSTGFHLYVGTLVKQIPSYIFYSTEAEKGTRISQIEFDKNSQCKEIGAYAFSLGTGNVVKSIVLPDSVEKISTQAFSNIKKISSITIGQNVNRIEEDAFQGSKIESLVWNSKQCFDFSSDTPCFTYISRITFGKNVIRIPSYFVNNNESNILSLAFAMDGVCEEIGTYAFYNSKISQLNLPESIHIIKDYAFSHNKIKGVLFPNSVQKIGAYAFSHNLIEQVQLPNSIEILHEGVFQGCYFSKEYSFLRFGTNLTEIEAYAFADCMFSSITLPDSLEKIGAYAFSNCKKLEHLDLPVSLVEIGAYAFQNCNSLKTVNFQMDLKPIGNWRVDNIVISKSELKFEDLARNYLCEKYIACVWLYKRV